MKSKLLAVTLVFCLLLALAGAAYAGFSDLNGHWAQKQVEKWADKGLVGGYQDGTFRPNKAVTRAEFVALVNRAMNKQNTGATIKFKDVRPGDWFYREVAAAVSAGYVGGYEDGTFRPNQPITRQEAASIISRLLNLESGEASVLGKFKDAGRIGSWARGSVAAVVARGLMGGYSDGTFGPAMSITRAETVVVLDRAITGETPQPPEEEVKVTGVKLDKNTLSLSVGSTVQLRAAVIPDNATNKKVTWSTSDEKIATVDDQGNVKGVAEGKATITVTTADGNFKDTCEVAVVRTSGSSGSGGGGSTTIPVTGVSLDKTSLTMTVGESVQLTATVSPGNATNKNVTWTSSNPAVATVDNTGKVTAVAAGTATITVKTEDGGKTATCVVTVSKWPKEVENVVCSSLAGNTAVKVYIKADFAGTVSSVTVNGQAAQKQQANPLEWRVVLSGSFTVDDLTVEVNTAAAPSLPEEVADVVVSYLAGNTAVKVFIKPDLVNAIDGVAVNGQPAVQQQANPAEWRTVLGGTLAESELNITVTRKQATPPPQPGEAQLIDTAKSNITYSATFGTNAYIYILPGKNVTSVRVGSVEATYIQSNGVWTATLEGVKAGDVVDVVASGPDGSETRQFTVVDLGV
ncbi:S-layer homology domain-containing protein [Desulfofundulus thermosubterraneus]|uniref:S-layer homology domain-containing protein n=1 Tax=Desulfofundulus thermosubterraneus DSM 16057 TaxID=1121432 RepID=A0A1M6GU16_9FIRM|nr:S-layer homology domain-containing protein [Desulfofundulus thermosubterraneus]SHJ13340.1 S-layer homology domain-containing protein [Desulfofundulus thermosubterraneus DSM 16057]